MLSVWGNYAYSKEKAGSYPGFVLSASGVGYLRLPEDGGAISAELLVMFLNANQSFNA